MLRRAIPSVVTLLLGVAVVAWTVWLPTSLDALWPWRPVAESSTGGLLAVIWANVLQPVVAYIIMFFLVGALFRHRWRDLSGSMLLAIGLTVSITTVLKSLVGRTRPDTPWIGHLDALASYPSGHAAAGAALAIGIVQTTWALSRHLRTTVLVAVASALLAAAVAIGRLVLSVHHVSDVLGGAIVALFSAALAATVTGAWNTTPPIRNPRTIHVVWHPGRVRGRRSLERFLSRETARRGCPPPAWIPTTADDHGAGIAREAAVDGADLLLTVGGDGTTREVLGALAGNPVPVGLIPSGSANLLAKNLSLPLDAARAVRVALDSPARPLDLLRVEVDDDAPRWAVAMVGAGADAAVLRDTSELAKRAVGPFGYLLAGLRHVDVDPVATTVTLDGDTDRLDASLLLVGNVGSLHPGVTLLPAADPSDGRLDLLVATPSVRSEVLAMISGVLTRRRDIAGLERRSGHEVAMLAEHPVPFQIDGDVVGDVTRVRVTVSQGAALIVA